MHGVRSAVAVMCLGLGLVTMAALADHDEDEEVEELMERTHEGRRSPYRQVKAQAEAAAPAWPVVDAALPRLDAMRKALVQSKNEDIKGSADGYADAVEEIIAAARNRNAPALRTAFKSLSESCGDCHFRGGVGGELDD